MQKLSRKTPIVYFVLLLLATTLSAVLSSHSYEFIITNRVVWFAMSVLIQIALLGICVVKRKELSKLSVAFSQALPLLALAYYYVIDSFISMVPSGIVALYAFLCFLPCYIISLIHMHNRMFRVICAILNTILLFVFAALFLLAVTFGSIGEKTVTQQAISPNELYLASVISADSGALGGATTIRVEEIPSSVNVWFGRITKVQQIYAGSWSAYQKIAIQWKDDRTLLINGNAYPIPES